MRIVRFWLLISLLLALNVLAGCYFTARSNGGGQIGGTPAQARRTDPTDIWLEPGYKIEVVCNGLNFPTGVTFDDKGGVYITEAGYSWGGVTTQPRLVHVIEDGVLDVIAKGHNGPWNGVAWHDGNFFIAEGGHEQGGRIIKIASDGTITSLVDNLPSFGDHQTNGPVVGRDNYVYFGQGTATNSGVVGTDNFQNGWLKHHPEFHDIPGQDIVLAGVNYQSNNPFHPLELNHWYQRYFPTLFAPQGPTAITGAFSPFGTPTHPGQVIKGQVPCTGAIMRVPIDGGPVELVAWGLRNPFGLAFSPDGHLFATENQFDVRGSRPIWGCGDVLWKIDSGRWYGWPDYYGDDPVDNANLFGARDTNPPVLLLAKHPGIPPKPLAKFGVHASADGFDFCRSRDFGTVGDVFVAEFGDLAPQTGKIESPVGFNIVRVEPEGGIIHPFAVNKGLADAPASKIGAAGLERPIAARFDPSGKALYIIDFGQMISRSGGLEPVKYTGVLWRITREEPQ